MNRKKSLLPIAVLGGALAGASLLFALSPEVESVEPEKALPIVRTIAPEVEDIRMTVRSQGTVAPRTESDLVPEVSGSVVWISPALVSGGFFSAGDPLLRIDDRDYAAALARAKSDVARAEGEAEYAASELRRQRGLARSNANSPSQLSNARRAERVARANLEASRVSLEQAERDLARTEIAAPFDGRVRDEQVDVGQFVTRGAPVATLYATDFAEIRLPLADRQLAYLDLPGIRRAHDASDGPAVRLRAHFAGAEHVWSGRIVRTEGEIDPQSRMVHVVARVKNPYGMRASTEPPEASPAETADGDAPPSAEQTEPAVASARPEPETSAFDGDQAPLAVGLFVRAEIDGRVAEDVIAVPRAAMRDESRLLVVDPEGRLRLRDVDVLRFDRDEVLIRAALEPGEQIVVSPIQVVVEGMKVRTMSDETAEVPS